jgi:hypothetical protein
MVYSPLFKKPQNPFQPYVEAGKNLREIWSPSVAPTPENTDVQGDTSQLTASGVPVLPESAQPAPMTLGLNNTLPETQKIFGPEEAKLKKLDDEISEQLAEFSDQVEEDKGQSFFSKIYDTVDTIGGLGSSQNLNLFPRPNPAAPPELSDDVERRFAAGPRNRYRVSKYT